MKTAFLAWFILAAIFVSSLCVAAKREPNRRGTRLRTLAKANPRFLL